MKNCIVIPVLFLLCMISCKKDEVRTPDTTYNPSVVASDFTKSTIIDNPFYKYVIGKKYVYESVQPDGVEHIEYERTNQTKVIMGITCVVEHFVKSINNVLVEDTYDWVAQDNQGNVWYMGEAVDNYDPTTGAFKDHHGAWEAGVDGAKPGIIMLANPQVGNKYRQEYYFNNAEDEAEVVATGVTVTVPQGTYTNCVKTRDWTALEPDVNEYKYYASGLGLIKEEEVMDPSQKSELIEIK